MTTSYILLAPTLQAGLLGQLYFLLNNQKMQADYQMDRHRILIKLRPDTDTYTVDTDT